MFARQYAALNFAESTATGHSRPRKVVRVELKKAVYFLFLIVLNFYSVSVTKSFTFSKKTKKIQ